MLSTNGPLVMEILVNVAGLISAALRATETQASEGVLTIAERLRKEAPATETQVKEVVLTIAEESRRGDPAMVTQVNEAALINAALHATETRANEEAPMIAER